MTLQKNKKKTILIVMIGALFISAIVLVIYSRSGPKISLDDPSINTEPATQLEKQEAEKNKEEIAKKQDIYKEGETGNTDSSGKVTVTITSANQTTINSYIAGVFEEGGICTATFTQSSTSFTKSSEGFQNVSYTQCAPINLVDSDFPSPGTWKVFVKYKSDKSEGISESKYFEVVK